MKKIFMALAFAASILTPASAQTTETKDSVYVVKNGVVVGAYEVGTDVDCLTFNKPDTPVAGNFAQYGSIKEELKSAIVIKQQGLVYVLASTVEGQTDYDELTEAGNYLFVAIPESLVGQEIKMSEYVESDDMIQALYMNADYDILAGTNNYDWSESGYAEGIIKVDLTDSQVSVSVSYTPDATAKEPGTDFTASYTGSYPSGEESTNTFVYDTTNRELKSAFYKTNEEDATVDFYLTYADITDAKLVEDCYHYAHIQVPYSALWQENGFSITGDTEFQFDLIDNLNEEAFHLSKGNVGDAIGTIKVVMQSEDTYTIDINIENFGSSHTFTAHYNGQCMLYDLSTPSAYRLQNQDDVPLKSAVVTLADDLYTVYLSQKETLDKADPKADADIVVVVPKEFLNDGLKGFSGGDDRAKISITYDGVTYNQANTTKGGDSALAMGGNANLQIEDGKMTIDFTIFNIYKYDKANLTGHYEGAVTVDE